MAGRAEDRPHLRSSCGPGRLRTSASRWTRSTPGGPGTAWAPRRCRMLRDALPWNARCPVVTGHASGAGATGLEPATSGVTGETGGLRLHGGGRKSSLESGFAWLVRTCREGALRRVFHPLGRVVDTAPALGAGPLGGAPGPVALLL